METTEKRVKFAQGVTCPCVICPTTLLTHIVNSEQISHIVLVFSLLALNNKIPRTRFSFRKASGYLKH